MGLDESLKIKTKIFVQSQEQVAQGVKDQEIIAIKSLIKSIKTNPKVNIYKIHMGIPWFRTKSKGVVGVPTGPEFKIEHSSFGGRGRKPRQLYSAIGKA